MDEFPRVTESDDYGHALGSVATAKVSFAKKLAGVTGA